MQARRLRYKKNACHPRRDYVSPCEPEGSHGGLPLQDKGDRDSSVYDEDGTSGDPGTGSNVSSPGRSPGIMRATTTQARQRAH